MSGFDVMMRSQESVAQNQRFYDSQRYQGDQQMVQTLGQTAQFAVQQQNIHRELGMQEAEVGARLTSIQQQQQMDAYKLQMMAAMDQADLGRESVRQAKLANDSMQVDLQMKQKALENYGTSSRMEQIAAMAQTFRFSEEMAASDHVVDIGQDGAFKLTHDKTRAAEVRSRLLSQRNTTDFNAKRNYWMQRFQMAKDLADEAGMQEAASALESLEGSPSQGDQATGPQQQGFGHDTGMRQQQAAAFQAALAQPTEGPLGSIARMDPATQAAVSQGLAVYGEYLTKARGIAPDMAPRYVMAAAQRDPLPVMFALSNAGYSDARIRLWLLSTGKSEKDADNLLNLHRKELEEVLRPVRGR